MQLPGKGRHQGGALGGEDGDGAGRSSASPPGDGHQVSQSTQFSSPCVPISPEEPLQNQSRSCLSPPTSTQYSLPGQRPGQGELSL